MKRIILLCCIAMALTGCSNKDKANIIPQGSDAPPVEGISVNNGDKQDSADPELITDRVNAIYAAVAEAYPEINDITPSNDQLDDAYCTSEWKTLVQMVNSKSAENMGRESFFDADYWIMGQDWGKITISDLKVNVKDNTHANAFGAFEISKLVVEGMKRLNIDLINYLRDEWPGFNPSKPDDWQQFYWPLTPFGYTEKPDGN